MLIGSCYTLIRGINNDHSPQVDRHYQVWNVKAEMDQTNIVRCTNSVHAIEYIDLINAIVIGYRCNVLSNTNIDICTHILSIISINRDNMD